MKTHTHQTGAITLAMIIVAILVGIALALLLNWNATQDIVQANKCRNTLITLQNYDQQWRASCAAGSPDQSLCEQMNTMIDQYNNKGQCGKEYGMLPKQSCTCPPLPGQ